MYQVIPNTHSWQSLEGILVSFSIEPERMTKEYLIIGLKNTIKREYEINQGGSKEHRYSIAIFSTIEDMIKYIDRDYYTQETFCTVVRNNLNYGFDLKRKVVLDRTDVYKCIDAERNYQDMRWNTNLRKNEVPDNEKSVAEWINYIEFHLQKAKNAVYHLQTQEALAEIRKVSALGVRTMEIHGAPERIIKLDTAPNTAGTKCCDGDCACKNE